MLPLSRSPETDRLIFLAAGIFIIIAGIKLVSEFIGPLVIAFFAAIVFSFISNWLEQKGFTSRGAKLASFTLFIICLIGMFVLIGIAVAPILENLLHYQDDINENLDNLQSIFNNTGFQALKMIEVNKIGSSFMTLSMDNVKGLVNQISDLMIIIFTTLFLLLEANGFSKKIHKIIGQRNEKMLQNFQEFGDVIIEYIIIRTKVNLTIGFLFTIVLYILGVEGALLWGFLMFMLGYVPYIGFILAVIPPTILAAIEISPLTAGIVLFSAVIINTIAENLIFPQLAGKGLNLSPAVIFISLLFWGFLLGGSGFILGVPLTVLLYTILKSSDETKWIADLLSLESDEDQNQNKA